ncbi:MAG: heme-binding protein [Sinobacteraceae bacterium]|nr:heme-binding protein [Nevskiaceae bacterium]
MRRAVSQSVVHWEAAQAALAAAVQKAEALGVKVNVAVVDSGGNLAGFLRMPGAFLHSIDIAIDKAYTAAGFGMPTGDWPRILQESPPAVRDGLPRRPRVVAFGGGFPIEVDGERIGAIGVSGGSEQEDEQCARAGLEAINAAD